jgi:hypothetical protein
VQGEGVRGRGSQEVQERVYTLKIHKRDRDCIIPLYIDHINARAVGYKHQNRSLHGTWNHSLVYNFEN